MRMGGGSHGIAGVLAIASLLPAFGCRDEGEAGGGTETDGASSSEGSGSSGSEPTGSTAGICVPGQARACYEGPPGTEGVGACAAGQQVCTQDGAGWSACMGQVWPQPAERCDTPDDDDCDGWAVCEPTVEWVQSIPGVVRQLAFTPAGRVIVVGSSGAGDFQGEALAGMFVLELDTAGTLQWARATTEGDGTFPFAMQVDDAGAITIAGRYDGFPDLGGGTLPEPSSVDAFVVRYAADGTYLWHHASSPSGYYALALGPDGTTFVAGGRPAVAEREPPAPDDAFFVEALDPRGEPAWIQVGRSGEGVSLDTISLAVTDAGELAVGLVAGNGTDLSLGEMPLEVDAYQAVVVARLALDGTPLSYAVVPEDLPSTVNNVRLLARPGGLLAVSSVTGFVDDMYMWQVMLLGLDAALLPLSEHRTGRDAHLVEARPYGDGTTLLSLEFSGALDLGPVGVGVQQYQRVPVIAAVDDQGNARFAEVLYTTGVAQISAVAAGPDGAVLVAGRAFDGSASLAGMPLEGSFLLRLRP